VLYHHSHALFDPGEVIHGGNFGRLIRGMSPYHSQATRESIWEAVRIAEFTHLPSRLSAVFAYDDASTAMDFRARTTNIPGLLPWVYEVEPVRSEAVSFKADLQFIDMYNAFRGAPTEKAETEKLARRYWSGERVGPYAELLVFGDLRVLGIHLRTY
jgi:hypothetical protein